MNWLLGRSRSQPGHRARVPTTCVAALLRHRRSRARLGAGGSRTCTRYRVPSAAGGRCCLGTTYVRLLTWVFHAPGLDGAKVAGWSLHGLLDAAMARHGTHFRLRQIVRQRSGTGQIAEKVLKGILAVVARRRRAHASVGGSGSGSGSGSGGELLDGTWLAHSILTAAAEFKGFKPLVCFGCGVSRWLVIHGARVLRPHLCLVAVIAVPGSGFGVTRHHAGVRPSTSGRDKHTRHGVPGVQVHHAARHNTQACGGGKLGGRIGAGLGKVWQHMRGTRLVGGADRSVRTLANIDADIHYDRTTATPLLNVPVQACTSVRPRADVGLVCRSKGSPSRFVSGRIISTR